MKFLFVVTVGSTMTFFQSLIHSLIETGNVVDIACNNTESHVLSCYREWGCTIYTIPFNRSPYSLDNIRGIKELCHLVQNNGYDVVHCHTPIAATCTRIACRRVRKKGAKVFYTAHGFHFYKGAPLINWLIYYPIEKMCAHWTDVLITINQEDYQFAKKHLKAIQVRYVPGVGIDVNKFKNTPIDREKKRSEIGIPKGALLLLSVGELNKNKNHEIVIKALSKIQSHNLYYIIVGSGMLCHHLSNIAAKCNVGKQVVLLGYRKDVAEIYKAADIYILPSLREGLNVSLMEAMASGLLCLASKIRGNEDLLNDEWLFNPTSQNEIEDAIVSSIKAIETMKTKNWEKQVKAFPMDVESINLQMENLYFRL